jgi:antitoxin ParD1/3/4
MATNVHLTPDLENFARECVESGRYNNVSEVMRSALRLLQDSEAQRNAFMAMLRASRREADRKGTHSIESVAEEMDAIISGNR